MHSTLVQRVKRKGRTHLHEGANFLTKQIDHLYCTKVINEACAQAIDCKNRDEGGNGMKEAKE